MKKRIPIETVRDITPEEFSKRYFHSNKPVVVKAAMPDSTIMRSWNPDYLKQKIGNRKVDFITSINMSNDEIGLYNYNKAGVKVIKAAFSDLTDLFTTGKYKKGEYYLAASSIHEHFPELSNDISLSHLASENDLQLVSNIWYGCAGCISHLHFDSAQNFLLQVYGRKELTLFSPEDNEYLYQDIDSKHTELSKVNLESIDYDEFPLIRKAQPYHCVLEPGDMLFLPMYWWHQVKSIDTSISVNYWWHRFELVEGSEMIYFGVAELKEMMAEFVRNGISIDQPDYQGETMLIKAVVLGYTNVVEALLTLGADRNKKSKEYFPGSSAEEIALKSGNADLISKFGTTLINN